MVYWSCSRPLPLLSLLHPRHQGGANFPHSFIFPNQFFSDNQQSSRWRGSLSPWPDQSPAAPVSAHTLQSIGDEKFQANKALENIFCPDLNQQALPTQPIAPVQPILPAAVPTPVVPPQPTTPPPVYVPVAIQPIVELQPTTPPTQLSQQPAQVSQSKTQDIFPPQHRYPTRFSAYQENSSMSCTSKYVYAAVTLSQSVSIPLPPVTPYTYHIACPAIDPETGASLEYRHLAKGPDKTSWVTALANNIGRLAQGFGTRMPTGNNTIFCYHPSEIAAHKKLTYGRLVADIRALFALLLGVTN